MCEKVNKWLIVSVVVVLAAIIIGLLAGSVAVLEYTEVGFAFDTNSQTINLQQLYGPGGRHFIGVGKRFVIYPTRTIIIRIDKGMDASPISVFTKDGQSVVITCTVMFQLDRNKLSQLYLLYGENRFRDNFIRIGITAIRNAAPKFTANDYFLNRTAINQAYFQSINEEYSKIYGKLTYFLLHQIDLPDKLEIEISKKIVTNQAARTTESKQVATLIRKDTEVQIQQGDLGISQRLTAANINYTNTILQAEARAQQIVLAAEAQALVDARTILNLSQNETKVLINWLWQRYLKKLDGTNLWVGFKGITQLFQ